MKNFYLIFFLLLSNIFVSQELNCEVVVEARQTGNENLQVLKHYRHNLLNLLIVLVGQIKLYDRMKKLIVQCLLI